MSITSSTIGKRTFKVILLGDSSTGKTSIIERFVNNKFEEKDNVLLWLCSLLSALIFSVRTSRTTAPPAGCSCGTRLVRRGTAASFRVI
jgi:GTPase SAR1 family protein